MGRKSRKRSTEFINGLRVTDEETMEIAEMVLGRVNKSLVTMVEALGVKASRHQRKRRRPPESKEESMLTVRISVMWAKSAEVDPQIFCYDLMEKDFLPIICPVGLDDEFNTYNINADDAACAIARAVGANKLAFLTDIEGLYRDFE